jgi:hypothetical protein
MKAVTLIAFLVPHLAIAGSSDLSFAEIREACLDPAKFQNQIAPSNLQVTCEERATKWVGAPSKTLEMPRSREIISSLSSDKYQVAPSHAFLDLENQVAACPRFKEVLETLSFTKATTCDELIAFEGTETEFCSQILDEVRDSNKHAINVSDTGNEIDLCETDRAPYPDERRQRGQRGQRGQRR